MVESDMIWLRQYQGYQYIKNSNSPDAKSVFHYIISPSQILCS